MGIAVALMGGMMGMPAFFVLGAEAMGMPLATANIAGWVLHFLVSIIVGVVFGVAVVNIRALRPTTVGKTLILGVAAGIVAYVILFVPIMMTLMPPFLMQMMKMTPAQVAALAQTLLGAGFVVHMIYGAVLGGVFWYGRPK